MKESKLRAVGPHKEFAYDSIQFEATIKVLV